MADSSIEYRELSISNKLLQIQLLLLELDEEEREVEIIVSTYEFGSLYLSEIGKRILEELDPDIWRKYDFTLEYPQSGTSIFPRHHPYLIRMAKRLGKTAFTAPFEIQKVSIPRYSTYKIKVKNITYREDFGHMEREKVRVYIPSDISLTNLEITGLKSDEEVDRVIQKYLDQANK